MPRIERRQNRSEVPAEALQLYVDRLLQRIDARAVAVSDARGLLIAGSAHAGDLETLGALAAVGEAVADGRPDLVHAAAGGARIRYERLTVQDRPLYAASVGGGPLPVEETQDAIERILFERVP